MAKQEDITLTAEQFEYLNCTREEFDKLSESTRKTLRTLVGLPEPFRSAALKTIAVGPAEPGNPSAADMLAFMGAFLAA